MISHLIAARGYANAVLQDVSQASWTITRKFKNGSPMPAPDFRLWIRR